MAAMLAFWAAALVVGLFALPIGFVLLRRLPDAGAGLALPLGLVLTGYIYFILRVAHVLPFGRGGYLLALVIVGLVSLAVAGHDRLFGSTLRRALPALPITIGLFSFAFFAYVAFRSYNADISGTEQPMDFMYLNATLTSKDYPPKDPWMAGKRASYYYFGYLQAGVLTSVSDVPASTGYNLFLAYTFGAAAVAIASLGYALARWLLGSRARKWAIGAGALAAGLLLLVGSLSAIFELSAAHGDYNAGLFKTMGVEWLIPCKPGQTTDCFSGPLSPRTTAWYPTEFWFWWRGSRIIPDTITEFPFFSFLLGDMHPHVMSIPLVLLTLGLSAAAWRGRRRLDFREHLRRPAMTLALAVIFGALAFENAWDILTFTALFALGVLARNVRARRADGPAPRLVWGSVRSSLGYLWPILVLAVVLYIPWYRDFSSQASGFEAYAGKGTRPPHAFMQFGPLLLAGLLVVTWAFRRIPRGALFDIGLSTLWVPILPFALWLALLQFHGGLNTAVDARGAGGWITLVLYGAEVWLLSTATVALVMRRSAGAPVAAACALGVLLIYGSELFYIRDIFNGVTPRLNTVFKLTYQAWIVLSLGGAVALVAALREVRSHRNLAGWLAVPVAVVIVAGLVYPVTAGANRTEDFQKETALDGDAFLARTNPDEYALTRWVRDHTDPNAVIVEATGRKWTLNDRQQPQVIDGNVDYSDAGRISERTGRATPIGWYFHEVQWRGDTPSVHSQLDRRQTLVDTVYTNKDPAAVVDALGQLGASYVIVGSLETGPGARYPAATLPAFDQFLDVAFRSGPYSVYELPVYRVVATS